MNIRFYQNLSIGSPLIPMFTSEKLRIMLELGNLMLCNVAQMELLGAMSGRFLVTRVECCKHEWAHCG